MNCDRFHDRLVDLVAGRLNHSRAQEMIEHSAVCKDCEAVLALEEALQTERSSGIADQVPAEWVDSMWPRVEKRISARQRPSRRTGPARWAVAATAAILLLGAIFVLGRRSAEVGRETGTRGVASVESPIPSRGTANREVLMATLERLPERATLLSAREAGTLLERSAPLRRWMQETPILIDTADGVQVDELRRALMSLPTEDVLLLPASLTPREIRRWLERRV